MTNNTANVFTPGKVHFRVGLLGIFLILSLLSPQIAHGHASLLSSTPEDGEHLDSAPTEVVLEFSEPVGLVEGGTTLHSEGSNPHVLTPQTSGNQVIIPLESLTDGAYIVQWRVISADSHPISGTVSFAVGDADPGDVVIGDDVPGWVELARSAAVGVKYIGLLAALGVLMVGWAIVRHDLALVSKLSSRFAAIGILGILLELPLAAMIQQGTVPLSIQETWSAVTSLQSNTLVAAVMGGILVVLAIVTQWMLRSELLRWRIGTGLMFGAVLTLVLSGHSRTREPVWLMMLSDAVHVVVAAIWLGGIILLVIGLRGRWQGEGFVDPEASANAVSRFSSIAGYTAVAVGISGIVMAIIILDSLEALYRTDYGISLLIKIGLVGAVAVLAAINRFRLIPRLVGDTSRSLSRLRHLVTLELVILVAVIALTGSLVHHDPNVAADVAENAQQSASITLYEGEDPLDADHTLRLTVESHSGQISVFATIIDNDRNIVVPDSELQISWFLPEQDLGPISQSLQIDATTGSFQGAFSLPATGEWELAVQIRIDRFTDSRTTINVVVPD